MHDLSLHILDLIENSIRAKASVIRVTIAEKVEEDTLEIVVEDNGTGLAVSAEKASDPFYTTKDKGKTGLGLSLLRAAAEEAGGSFSLSPSPLGGLSVKTKLRISHVDRAPLGNIASTISSVVITNPDIDLICRIHLGTRKYTIRAADVMKELPAGARSGIAAARLISRRIWKGLERLKTGIET